MMNYLVFGASRGLGALFAHELPQSGDTVWMISRSEPELTAKDGVKRIWINADLGQSGVTRKIANQFAAQRLDVCIYNAGIWEENAFTEAYDYEAVPDEMTEKLIAVNLTSAITGIQKLLPALRKSSNGKIILIGASSGLENSGWPEIANNASKFGLRGVAHGLREVLRDDQIATTVINLGNVGVITYSDGTMSLEPVEDNTITIPIQDLLRTMRYLINLSSASVVKEIDLSAVSDRV
ncbi:MAG: SDR family oxidoreductase [Chloroflexota bacterium]